MNEPINPRTWRGQTVDAAGVALTGICAPVNRFLSQTGESTGVKLATVDGSVTPVSFFIAPPATGVIELVRMLVQVRGTGVFAAEKYGALAGLTNGIDVGLADANGVITQSFFDGMLIKTNAEWARVAFDIEVWGSGDTFLSVRWTFQKGGYRILLDADVPDVTLAAVIADDLSTLTGHTFLVQGFQRP